MRTTVFRNVVKYSGTPIWRPRQSYNSVSALEKVWKEVPLYTVLRYDTALNVPPGIVVKTVDVLEQWLYIYSGAIDTIALYKQWRYRYSSSIQTVPLYKQWPCTNSDIIQAVVLYRDLTVSKSSQIHCVTSPIHLICE
jgi:hypothetical protein